MKHILVVEDEQHLAFGIKYNLEAEGYEVTHGRRRAGGAASCSRKIRSGVDLVILDLMLPGMSGYAVCEALREKGNDVPVLMLSARTLVEDRIRGYDVGADQYLQKPFELEELLSMTRNLLARRAKPSAAAGGKDVGPVYEFGRAHGQLRHVRRHRRRRAVAADAHRDEAAALLRRERRLGRHAGRTARARVGHCRTCPPRARSTTSSSTCASTSKSTRHARSTS